MKDLFKKWIICQEKTNSLFICWIVAIKLRQFAQEMKEAKNSIKNLWKRFLDLFL